MSAYSDEVELRTAQEAYAAACDARLFAERPSTRYRPSLSRDGDQWCALYGANLEQGVCAFGVSPEAAYLAFDAEWVKPLAARGAV